MCAMEPKESQPMPEAFGSFEMDGEKHQKAKSKMA